MQIFTFIKPLLKWWWLISLSTAIAIGVSFWVSRPLPPVYLAHTTLMVGRAISDPNPSGNEFALAQQLAVYYTSIAKREPIYNATKETLGLAELPEFTTQTVSNSPFIEIMVEDTDPQRAAIVANELANQLILQSPTAPQKEDIERQQFIEAQLVQMQNSIEESLKEIEEKQSSLTTLTGATEIQDVQAEITALESKVALLQDNYAALVTSSSGAINTISVIEVATVPTIPIGPNKLLIIAMAALAGLALSAGVAYLMEFLDRTIKTADDVEEYFQTAVLGYIHEFDKNETTSSYVIEKVRSPAAEAFRSLRTNIGFAAVGKPFRTLAITSAHQGEGKTTVSINLAVSMAQAEKKVRLVDVDLRRPRIHSELQLPIEPGLTNAFQFEQSSARAFVTKNSISENLEILTSGRVPPNPTELINSSKMDQILADLLTDADTLILDCPPIIIPDAAIIVSKVDGVLLVIQPGRVRYETAQSVVEQIQRSGGRLIGVVFNQVKQQEVTPYTSYQYYGYRDQQAAVQEEGSVLAKMGKSFLGFLGNTIFKPRKSEQGKRNYLYEQLQQIIMNRFSSSRYKSRKK